MSSQPSDKLKTESYPVFRASLPKRSSVLGSKTPSLEEANLPPSNNLPLLPSLLPPEPPEPSSEKLSLQKQKAHTIEIAKINKELYTLSCETLPYRELLHSIYKRITKLHNRKHTLQAALLSPVPVIRLQEKKEMKDVLRRVSPEQLALIQHAVEEIIQAKNKEKEEEEND